MSKAISTGNDIASIFTPKAEGVSMEVIHPGTGKPIGLTLVLRSINDEAVKPITRKIENERLKLERTRKGGFNAEQIRQNSIDIIAACVIGWEWHNDENGVMGNINGEQLPFNPVNVRNVLSLDVLRAQVDAELMDESRFFGN